MPEWLPPTIAVAIITAIGTIIGVAMTRRTAKETNQINATANEITEAANKAAESDNLIKNLSAEVKRQDERLDRLDERVQRQDATITKQGAQIRKLETNDWNLRQYVHRLIAKIRSLGEEPPAPPHDLEL